MELVHKSQQAELVSGHQTHDEKGNNGSKKTAYRAVVQRRTAQL